MVVQNLFWELTGVEDRIAQAVFSGVRMDAAQGLIKRVLEVKPRPELDRAELDAAVTASQRALPQSPRSVQDHRHARRPRPPAGLGLP